MRKPFVAGNWKMNTDSQSGLELVKALNEGFTPDMSEKVNVAVIPPFVYLQNIIEAAKTGKVAVGAQDVYFESNGAFTGEISVEMLKDIGCNYALCGHSERRHVIGETDEIINKKVHACISGGLLVILCVGETLEQRESEKTEEIIKTQLENGLAGLNADKVSAVTIAYEPVWAIGTGLTATPEQAQGVHKFIREQLTEMYEKKTADDIIIQYGGSVKPGNAAELMNKEDIDGVLVGGASLKADDFLAIIKAAL
jgi:triosephosphate isomerase